LPPKSQTFASAGILFPVSSLTSGGACCRSDSVLLIQQR
jgi:hypothetical protein